MQRVTPLLVLLIALSQQALTLGQLRSIDLAEFGPETVSPILPFSEGVIVEEFFARWGIRFSGQESTPVVRDFLPVIHILPPSVSALFNQPNQDSSAGRALIMDFESPVRRVGFSALTESEATSMTIRAFDAAGEAIGELSDIVVEPPSGALPNGLFVGVETPPERPMSKLTVSYGSSEEPEWLTSLLFEFASRPLFSLVIPHLGAGPLLGGGSLHTDFSFLNLSSTAAQGRIKFYSSAGEPLPLALSDGRRGPVVDFQFVRGAASYSISTAAVFNGPVSGYALIESPYPIGAAAVFSTRDGSGRILGQAGIASSAPSLQAAGAFLRRKTSGTFAPVVEFSDEDTALAIVNMSDQTAHLWIRVQDESDQAGGFSDYLTIELSPGEHRAQFLTELFPGLEDRNLRGGLEFSSDRPVAIVTLQTNNGVAVSSLPTESLERP